MTKIKLQSIAINNFKKTRFLLLNLQGRNTNISGANGSGKTTVYKAYYWCLTGKTMEPNEVIQTLDENNEVIHKIETSVLVTLLIDDSYEVRLERRLTEDWKALGQPGEQLKGTKQSRFFNDVPLSAKEFEAKLNTICDLKTLLMLSDITEFMGLKMEDRRKTLLCAAGEVDEAKLMAPFPALLKAMSEKKSVDELRTQTLSTKKRANEELKQIPSRIDAQEKLKSSENFEALRKEKYELDAKIQDCDTRLKGSTEQLQSAKERNQRIADIEMQMEKRKNDLHTSQNEKESELRFELSKAQQEFSSASNAQRTNATENADRIAKKIKLTEKFEAIRKEWNTTNEKIFNFEQTDTCPLCGHKFTEEEKLSRKEIAISTFNSEKSKALEALQKEAEQLHEQITVLTGSINEYNKIIKPADDKAVQETQKRSNKLYAEIQALQQLSYTNDEQYKALVKELGVIRSESVEVAIGNDEVEEQKKQYTARRDEVIKLLAGEDTNQRIEEEKRRLEARSRELSQIISDCDNTLAQISDYRKAKVDAVEVKVNSFFQLARWRFFEKNVSNDDFQEVCICHHNGVDYNSTNGADRINLGVDIVAGLGKALGIVAPIFVDQKESAAELIETENQIITLEHIKDAQFTVTHF